MLLKFKIDLYPTIVLLKSAFSFTDRAYVHLDEREGYYFVELTPKEAAAPFDDREFINEMLFQTVRQEVSRKTKTKRE
ncbi:MAG: His-Xaa-Ser system protein HxsD, partial [Clostridia bacterium]|nr:His-Xaa-Ser system protein HxsD [Clostridia bacterium]